MIYTAISKLDPHGNPLLGECKVLVGDEVVEFAHGRAQVTEKQAAMIVGRDDVEVPGFGLDVPLGDIPEVAGLTAEEAALFASLKAKAGIQEDVEIEQGTMAKGGLPEPWQGYDDMGLQDVVAKLKSSPQPIVAVALEYEARNKKRKGVLSFMLPEPEKDPDLTEEQQAAVDAAKAHLAEEGVQLA